ncbi:Uncharacterised protein [Escherichia coli]|nr:Uncharacterised protein [Escherichia coli]CTX57362.1 Uncharacterised protein [Escherichia coli]
MGKAIIFIETPMFTRQIKQIATDDELKELQKELIGTPDKGDLIQQTGGLRKVRMAAGSQGKKWQCQNNLLSGDGRDYLFDYGLSEKCQR